MNAHIINQPTKKGNIPFTLILLFSSLQVCLIVQAFLKEHSIHVMCLEVATGESGTIDGAWVRVCEFFYLKKLFFLNRTLNF